MYIYNIYVCVQYVDMEVPEMHDIHLHCWVKRVCCITSLMYTNSCLVSLCLKLVWHGRATQNPLVIWFASPTLEAKTTSSNKRMVWVETTKEGILQDLPDFWFTFMLLILISWPPGSFFLSTSCDFAPWKKSNGSSAGHGLQSNRAQNDAKICLRLVCHLASSVG